MGKEARDMSTAELRQRWQKGTRYYEVLLRQDLWDAWIVTRVWGRRGSPLGRVRHSPCESYADGLLQVRQVQQRRTQRGYAPVGNDPLNILQGDGFESRR
jgi:hypothetical protein